MKKGEQLHQLIKALTPAEKKHIHININKFHPKKTSKNTLLFDSLNQQKKYTPTLVKEAYQVEGYSTKFLSADRNQLYDLVLTNLSDFHKKKTIEIQVNEGYQNAIMLFEKKLFQQALKEINRIIPIAEQLESHATLINFYHLQQRILKVQNRLQEAIKSIQKQTILWETQKRVNNYIELHYQSIALRIELAKVRSSENVQRLQEFMQHPLLKIDLPTHLGFLEQFHYLEIYCNYYFIRDNKQLELQSNQALVDLYNQYPIFKKNEPLNYLVFHTRILAIQRNLNPADFLDALNTYRTLSKEFQKQQKQAESIIFIFSYNYELDFYIQHQYWKEGEKVVPIMLKGLKKYQAFIEAQLQITAYYRIAYLYFMNNEYGHAIDILDKVINDFPSNLRPDVYSFSLIVRIIAHYEMGNVRLIPYLIKTAAYHLKKRDLLFQTEKVALQYLKRLSKVRTQEKSTSILNEFETTIKDLIKDNPYEGRSLQIFDFLTWINTKKGIQNS
jgi:tetratricopeptide (TPR) repeat protein